MPCHMPLSCILLSCLVVVLCNLAMLSRLLISTLVSRISFLYYCWLTNQRMRAKVENCLPETHTLSCCIRQRGILSPLLFSIYVDIILYTLEKSGFECFVREKYLNSYLICG